jgi:hypothetical protein
MKNVTTAIAWDYLGSSLAFRTPLLFFSVLGSFLILIAAPSADSTPFAFIAPQCFTLLMMSLVFELQSQIRLASFYSKPISTLSLVTHYYWGGALIIAAQATIFIGIFKLLVLPSLPIVWPVFCTVVLFGILQPWTFIGNQLALTFVVLLPVFWTGPMWMNANASSFRFTTTGFLIGCAAFLVSYALSVWRATKNRSGRLKPNLVQRACAAWDSARGAYADTSRQYKSPTHAYCSLDSRSRTMFLPAAVAIGLISIFFAFVVSAMLNGSMNAGINFSVSGISGLIFASVWIAIFIGGIDPACLPLLPPFAKSPISTRFINTLSISNQDITRATLKSSIIAVALSSTLILLACILLFTIHQITDSDVRLPNFTLLEMLQELSTMKFLNSHELMLQVLDDDTAKLPLDDYLPPVFEKYAMSFLIPDRRDRDVTFLGAQLMEILVAAALSFVLINGKLIFPSMKRWPFIWQAPIALLVLLLLTGVSAPTSIPISLLALFTIAMVTFAVLNVRSGDFRPISAVLICVVSFTLSLIFFFVLKKSQGFDSYLLIAILTTLTTLPFVAIPLAVRNARTT